jgi:hypothetical protein
MNYFNDLISLKQEADKLQVAATNAQELASRAMNKFDDERSKKLLRSLNAVCALVTNQLDGDWDVQHPGVKLRNDIVMMMLDGDLLHFKRLKLNLSLKTGVISAKILDVDPVSITYLKSELNFFSSKNNWHIRHYDLGKVAKDLKPNQIECLTDASYRISSYLNRRLG